MKVEPLNGPYEPLLLDIPLGRLLHSLLRRDGLAVATLVIDEGVLQTSKRPFIVPYPLKE